MILQITKVLSYLFLFHGVRGNLRILINVMNKPWALAVPPSLRSTSLIAEFIPLPLFSSFSDVPLPKGNKLIDGIVYLVYLHQAILYLGLSVLYIILLAENTRISVHRLLRHQEVWVRDPLDSLVPAQRSSIEHKGKSVTRASIYCFSLLLDSYLLNTVLIVAFYGPYIGRLWIISSTLLFMAVIECDITHFWREISSNSR
ncbi:hypothetical protein CPB84DRAFT_1763800 [Gymnopilus junonius]|uniref:Uncharacterized protein n=1 Tax=Gymnopilus junonius TaxID=109634 RepID=A0A9P5P084_GYMJU|nr:hypothetical protein CPB84DRAFT_1763800 [Gymnopilus junonius]